MFARLLLLVLWSVAAFLCTFVITMLRVLSLWRRQRQEELTGRMAVISGCSPRAYLQLVVVVISLLAAGICMTAVVSYDDDDNSSRRVQQQAVWKQNKTVLDDETSYHRPHDDPNHPWHWTRAHGVPKTRAARKLGMKRDCQGRSYADHYRFFHTHGYTLFQSCTLDEATLASASNYTASITTPRESNLRHPAIRQLAVDADTRELLEFLHGGHHRVFPYQTLNFPVATQQPLHSDLIHFDTMSPRTMMTAAWVALEDIGLQQGPLVVVPGSHLRGTWDFEEISLRDKLVQGDVVESTRIFNDLYGEELDRLVEEDPDLNTQTIESIQYGQTLIWAAALLHGGAPLVDPSSTRRSQVTHYTFEGATSYWVPRLSDPIHGRIHQYAAIVPCPPPRTSCIDERIRRWLTEQ